MLHRIPVIFNPNARSAKAADRLAALRDQSGRMELCPTSAAGDAARIAHRLATEGRRLIVAAGGDGTINEVANGLLRAADDGISCPMLGLLPFGTMNVLSLELGLPREDPAACWRLIEGGVAREIDVWELNGRAFLQLAGIGLDAEIIHATTWEQKKSLGPLSYVLNASKLIGKSNSVLHIKIPGRPDVHAKVVLLGSGRYYGGPIKVFPKAKNTDGLLDVVVMEHDHLWALIKGLGGMYLSGGQELPKGVHYFQTDSLEITADQPVAVEVDGELADSATQLRIRKRPQGLRVISPLLLAD